MKNEWYQLDNKYIYDILKSNENGLSSNEAQQRLIANGKNELPTKKKDSIILIFFNQFKDSIVIVMLFAMLFSFLIGETVDGFVILFIIMLDAVMGTVQEWSAGKNADALKNMIKAKAIVLRDNEETEINASDVVVGDILVLQSGQKIAADARIISSTNLTVDESMLTGESVACVKHNHLIKKNVSLMEMDNMLFAGTSIVTGRGHAIVVATATNTELGKIAASVNEVEEAKSPLSIRMDKFSKQVAVFIVLICIVLVVLYLIKDYPYQEIFLSVIALAVSAMPEGLPLALTMALSIGSNRMSKKNIIVKKLTAVESLGSTTVIASDKTGTLTVNEQTAKKIVLPNGLEYDISGTGYNGNGKISGHDIEKAYDVALLGVLNNEATLLFKDKAWVSHGDSIDIAFLALGYKCGIDSSIYKKIGAIPYESENKYSAIFYKDDFKNYISVKGSIDTVLDFCNVKNELKESILNQNEKLASDGYRVIALASTEVSKIKQKDFYEREDIPKLEFKGLVAFIDPIRKEVIGAIKEARGAGIKVVMITGDHPLTAFSIAKELKIVNEYSEVTTGEELDKYINNIKEFDKFIRTKSVFTRVTPIQKLRIVEAYKRMGEFVAVTGDGVNDAPAIKSANLGIAMGSGTDVAKETATMIITDDNFMSIVAGIREGRTAFSNIRKVTYMLISCGIAEVIFFILAVLWDFPMPLVAIQLLWLNVVTDGLQDMALSFEPTEEDIMKEKPRDTKVSVFDKLLVQEVLIAGMTIGLIVFGVWVYCINILNMDTIHARAYILALMVFMQNFHVLNCRSEKKSILKQSILKNKLLIISIGLAIILQILIMEVPTFASLMQVCTIPWYHLIIVMLLSLPIIIVMEIFKYIKSKDRK